MAGSARCRRWGVAPRYRRFFKIKKIVLRHMGFVRRRRRELRRKCVRCRHRRRHRRWRQTKDKRNENRKPKIVSKPQKNLIFLELDLKKFGIGFCCFGVSGGCVIARARTQKSLRSSARVSHDSWNEWTDAFLSLGSQFLSSEEKCCSVDSREPRISWGRNFFAWLEKKWPESAAKKCPRNFG